MNKPTIFISYAHSDREYLDRLLIHLRPLSATIDVWADSSIKSGANWETEIQHAIEKAKIAILLVSPDYLASDFIANKEIPALLESAQKKNKIILPILIRPSRIKGSELYNYQFLNSPDHALSVMSQYEQDRLMVRLASTIDDINTEIVGTKIQNKADIDNGIPHNLADEVANKVYEMMNLKTETDSKIKNEDSNLIFVIMSFSEEMEPIYEGIAEAAKKVGLIAKRVKDVPGDYRITNKILQMINTARIIVADLTHERPNVYFELGYARGLSKSVITIARRNSKIHFDVQDWTYIPYIDSRILEKELVERFKYELGK